MKRYVPKPLLQWLARVILRGSCWYLKRQTIVQKVWVMNQFVRINEGRITGYIEKTDVSGDPVGMILFYETPEEPHRKLRVDLTELKYDYGDRQWHFFRPGTADPEPRIPRDHE